MGKESAEIKRVSISNKSPTVLISKTNLQKELTKQWSLQHGVVSQFQVVEDGYALVLIKSPHYDTSVICKGLSNEGNKYSSLLKMLQKRGLVAKQERIKAFFIRKAFVWEAIDPAKDTFRSGDNVMIIVDDKQSVAGVRKSIAKPMK